MPVFDPGSEGVENFDYGRHIDGERFCPPITSREIGAIARILAPRVRRTRGWTPGFPDGEPTVTRPSVRLDDLPSRSLVSPKETSPKPYFVGSTVSLEREKGETVTGTITRIDHHKLYVDNVLYELKGFVGANIRKRKPQGGYYLEIKA